MAEIDAVAQQRFINSQMYPEVRLLARNQILADLLMRIFHDDDMYFDWSRNGYLTLDGGVVMTPEQMAALEEAVLEHKAKED